WRLHEMYPSARIRLEAVILGMQLDLLVHADGVRTAVELKYLAKGFTGVVGGERYELKNGFAQDQRRHDVIKDVARLERLIVEGRADVGWAVTLTNDPGYWSPGRGIDPIDAAFRLHEGRSLSGTLRWAMHAAEGTKANRDVPLVLTGTYACRWRPYSEVVDSRGHTRSFRHLSIVVAGAPRLASQVVEDVSAAEVPREAGGKAREQVLAAARFLASRSPDGTFTPAEVVAEVRRRGGRLADSTVRTHVVSVMCVNAPDNHAITFADLERVDRGRYRLTRSS
ncbi:MAG TPA: hypothetical protein VF821_00805, partial [Lentzea sp.]